MLKQPAGNTGRTVAVGGYTYIVTAADLERQAVTMAFLLGKPLFPARKASYDELAFRASFHS